MLLGEETTEEDCLAELNEEFRESVKLSFLIFLTPSISPVLAGLLTSPILVTSVRLVTCTMPRSLRVLLGILGRLTEAGRLRSLALKLIECSLRGEFKLDWLLEADLIKDSCRCFTNDPERLPATMRLGFFSPSRSDRFSMERIPCTRARRSRISSGVMAA